MYTVNIVFTDEDSGEVLDSTSREFEDQDKAADAFDDSSTDLLCMDCGE